MSNFMKAVVEEVLNGKKTTKISTPSRQTSNPANHDPLQQLNRPNYQNKNIEKRLAMLNNEPPNTQTSKPLPTEMTKQAKISHEDSYSMLKKVALSHGKSEQTTPRINTQPRLENARIIGSNEDGASIWFFPSVHPTLSPMFKRATQGYSVTVVTAKTCFPSQLLLLNEWLNVYPNLKYHLIWHKANNQAFTLELYDSDQARLEKIAQEMYQQLSKRSATYQLISPGAWISKQLGIMKSVESIGIVEGLSYFQQLVVLDSFYKQEHNPQVSIQVEQHYFLISGKTEQVKDALTKLSERM